MPSARDYDACLIDVYRTILRLEYPAVMRALIEAAACTPEALSQSFARFGAGLGTGECSMAEAMTHLLEQSGLDASPARVRALVEVDQRAMCEHAHLYGDTVKFLERLRANGIRTAFVSNCAENTRSLLAHLGVDVLVDALILSCEVGAEKPDAAIYKRALEALDVEPERSLFIDDQSEYCAGAEALGIRGIQIVRDPDYIVGPIRESGTVGSFNELDATLGLAR
jgi:HAD superfamily hydrolase (TIGR01509 family)